MTRDAIGAEVARLLVEAQAIQVSHDRPFILAAGWASPVYVDCRRLIGLPDMRRRITALATTAVQAQFPADAFDAVAGAETAGIPFAAWLADALDLPLRYVRKRPLGIGNDSQVEGGPVEGQRVLLMDDLTTDAVSKVAFARGLRAAGAVVTDVLSIFYHSAFPGADARLAEAGLVLHPLATWHEVLGSDLRGRLDDENRRRIEQFLADPVAWSARHGGRSLRQMVR